MFKFTIIGELLFPSFNFLNVLYFLNFSETLVLPAINGLTTIRKCDKQPHNQPKQHKEQNNYWKLWKINSTLWLIYQKHNDILFIEIERGLILLSNAGGELKTNRQKYWLSGSWSWVLNLVSVFYVLFLET